MQLKKIQYYFKEYHQWLKKARDYRQAHQWEAQLNFQTHWEEGAADFAAMYDRSLQNSQTRRLWKDQSYQPKAMMLKFIALQPDYAWAMFRDLFDERKDIGDRVVRFKLGCDELLRQYKTKHIASIDNNHYHEDNRMIALYLAFRYPLEYTFFDYPAFEKTMKKLGSVNIPTPQEIDRFFKTSRTLYKFAQKEEGLVETQRRCLPERNHFRQGSLLLIHDFYQYCARE
ncbi:MAG: hypothetical protein AAGG75_27490 [Bacteroidota bacterium]